MLQAAGLPRSDAGLRATGGSTKNGRRMSKTTGNVDRPGSAVARFGADPVRYFLMRQGSFGHDWDFTDEAFVGRFNADLANNLGNLVNRVTAMAERYRGGRLTAAPPNARLRARSSTKASRSTARAGRVRPRCGGAVTRSASSTRPTSSSRRASRGCWRNRPNPAPLDAVFWSAAEALRVAAVLLRR